MSSLYLGSTKISEDAYSFNVGPRPTYDDELVIQIPSTVTTLGSNMFMIESDARPFALKFAGNPPSLGTTPFKNAKITVYYPASNTKWTSSIKTTWQNNGGASSITWKTY